MSIEVTVQEEERTFDVYVGTCLVGKVTVNNHDDIEDNERYEASYSEDDVWNSQGYYKSLRDAAEVLVEREHGYCKIDTITRLKV